MSRRVLVVDDSGTAREVLNQTLSEAGYRVCTAENGQDALALVTSAEYDLLMTDLNMPQMDGIRFISEVRKIPGNRFTPIIILSGESKETRHKECIEAGASAYLQKPFKQEQVIGILRMIAPC